MSYTGEWTDTDVLVKEVFGSQICEHISVLNANDVELVLILVNCIDLSLDVIMDAFEEINEVDWLVLEFWVLSQHGNFVVNALGPVRYLIVYNLDALESLLQF